MARRGRRRFPAWVTAKTEEHPEIHGPVLGQQWRGYGSE
jgi:ribosomal protein L39E